MRMTIKSKLGMAFGAIMLLLIGLVYVSINGMNDTNDTVASLVDVSAESVELATAIKEPVGLAFAGIRGVVLAETDEVQDRRYGQTLDAMESIKSISAQLRPLLSDEEMRFLDEFERQWDDFRVVTERVYELAQINSNITGRNIVFNNISPLSAQIDDLMIAIDNAVENNTFIDEEALSDTLLVMSDSVSEMETNLLSAILASTDETVERFLTDTQAAQDDAQAAILSLPEILQNSGRAEMNQLSTIWAEYTGFFEQAQDMATARTNAEAEELIDGEGRTARLEATAAVNELVEVLSDNMVTDKAQATVDYQADRTALLAVAGMALVIGLAAALWISLSISRGLARAVELAKSISVGDLRADIGKPANDEVGDLLRSMSEMTDNLSEMAKVAEEIAAGNLTVHAKRRSDVDTLGIAFEDMLSKLRDVVSNASAASDGVAGGADAMSGAANDLSQGATEQAAAAQEASAAMEEMVANISQSADNASQTEKIATQAAQKAQESGEAVNEAVSAMKTIAEKINIIQEIARQTDLLALNAAVEAARAGQHGKGFAVVASEVRKLAERSQLAAQEIGELSGKTVDVSQKAGEMLESLVPSIRRTSDLVEEISAATREQNAGAEQVNQAIRELDSVIQQNAAASTQAASVSEQLAAQSDELRDVISFFNLEKVATKPAPTIGAKKTSTKATRNIDSISPGREIPKAKMTNGAVRPAAQSKEGSGIDLNLDEDVPFEPYS